MRPERQESIGHLKLLAPGRVLSLIETVKPQRWVDMIWGLSEGWWILKMKTFEGLTLVDH
jgi:nonribosomal peptide synthetase protein BlmVIII